MKLHNNSFSSNDAGKLFIFALLVIPSIFVLVGIVPVLFLLFGFLMLRKSGDFDHIETAARNYRIFCILAFLGMIGIVGWSYNRHLQGIYSNSLEETAVIAALSLIPLLYIAVMQMLFLNPMRSNRDRIEGKVSEIRGGSTLSSGGEIDIIKGERLRSFSVADELLKWAKLKVDGHITEEEFAEARRKLLERN